MKVVVKSDSHYCHCVRWRCVNVHICNFSQVLLFSDAEETEAKWNPKGSGHGSAITAFICFPFISQVRWWRPTTWDHWASACRRGATAAAAGTASPSAKDLRSFSPTIDASVSSHPPFYCTLCFIASCCVSLAKWYQVLLKRWFKTKMNSWVYMDNCVMINIFLVSGNAIQAFGNGTDVGVWQPQPPIEPTAAEPSITGRNKDQTSNALDALTDLNKLELNGDSLYHICGTSQVKLAKSFSVLGVCIHHVVESGSRGPNSYTTSLYCPKKEQRNEPKITSCVGNSFTKNQSKNARLTRFNFFGKETKNQNPSTRTRYTCSLWIIDCNYTLNLFRLRRSRLQGHLFVIFIWLTPCELWRHWDHHRKSGILKQCGQNIRLCQFWGFRLSVRRQVWWLWRIGDGLKACTEPPPPPPPRQLDGMSVWSQGFQSCRVKTNWLPQQHQKWP